jgi:subtilisin-like proprotein convertase family protein
VSTYTTRARILLVVLAALLALPLAPATSPVAAKNRARTVTRTFNNPTVIDLFGSAATPNLGVPYPSTIVVSGLNGTIRDVNLTLDAFSHQNPSDVEVLLVAPGGRTAVVMADVGGSADVAGVTLRLDDEAAVRLPDTNAITLQSGAFRPTNATNSVIDFKAPAPSAGANAALSVFDGTNPNGTWRLFVQDDDGPNFSGLFEGGWALEITAQVKAKKKRR